MKLKKLIVRLIVFLIIISIPKIAYAANEDKIHFISSKEGDGMILETTIGNEKHCGLIDAFGPKTLLVKRSNGTIEYATEEEAAQDFSLSYDRKGTGKIVENYAEKIGCNYFDFVILTHNHWDHLGGIPYLKRFFNDKTIVFYKQDVEPSDDPEAGYFNGEYLQKALESFPNNAKKCDVTKASEMTNSLCKLSALASNNNNISEVIFDSNEAFENQAGYSTNVKDNLSFTLGTLKINMYSLYILSNYNENMNSIVTLVTHTNKNKAKLSTAVLTGDIVVGPFDNENTEYKNLNYKINNPTDYTNLGVENQIADVIRFNNGGKVNLLKSAHHGYRFSNSIYSLDTYAPDYYITQTDYAFEERNISNIVAMTYLKYRYGAKSYYTAKGFGKNMGTYFDTSPKGAIVAEFDNTKSNKITIRDYKYNDEDENNIFVYDSGEAKDWLNSNISFPNGKIDTKRNVYNSVVYSYVKDNVPIANQWVQETSNGSWYRIGADGLMITGWYTADDGNIYYLSSSGAMVTGWQKIGNNWYYFRKSNNDISSGIEGAALKGWQQINSNWYYFGDDGKMYTGLKLVIYNGNSNYYYFEKDSDTALGIMQKGWRKLNGYWYFFRDGTQDSVGYTGSAVEGFATINSELYFFRRADDEVGTGTGPRATMVKGLATIDNETYYFRTNGNEVSTGPEGSALKNGCITLSSVKYCFDSDGKLINESAYITPPTESMCKSITYNGSEQTITKTAAEGYTWSNNKKTNAGSYQVTATLLEGYAWNDTTTDPKTITCTISKKKYTIPTMSTTSYTYKGTSITPTISNYNSSAMVKQGNVSATAVGNYVTTIKLRDTDNTEWKDGTISNKDYSWSIVKASRAKPTVTNFEGEYDGEPHTIEATGSGVLEYSEDNTTWLTTPITKTNAGIYTIYVRVQADDNHNASAVEEGTISIAKKKITKPSISPTSYTYNGSVKAPTIKGFNSTTMAKSGAESATNVGTYTITFSLKDSVNYEWSSGTSSNLSLTWKINKSTWTKPTVTDYSGEYDGAAHMIEATGSGILEYSEDNTNWSTTEINKTNAGTYTIYVRVQADANHKVSAVEEGTITITKKKITKPSLNPTSYTYNGSAKTPTIKGFNSTTMTKTGTESATDVGTYSITFGLTDPDNNEWSGSSTSSIVLTWKINKATWAKPTVTDYSGQFDGQPHTIEATGSGTLEYSDDNTNWSETLPTKTNVGTYTIYVRVKADANHKASSVEEGTITITKKKITKPKVNPTTYIYSGSTITPTLKNYSSTWMTKTGTESATNVGTYTITVSLRDADNTEWADETSANVSLTWKILKTTSLGPNITSYSGTYDGTAHTIEATGDGTIEYSTDENTWSETKPTRTNAGTTIVYARIKADATHNQSETTEGYIEISKAEITKPTLSSTSYTYNGSEKTPTITGFDSTLMTKTGTESATNVGTYTITIGLKDTNNTEWEDDTETIKLTWKINKATWAKPTVTDYIGEYDGVAHTIEATGSGTLEYSEDKTAWSTTAPSITEVGELTVYVRVKADANHKASAVSEGTITITKKKITKPSISPASYTYNGSSKTPTITGFDSTLMTKNGTESATNAGTYTVTISLKNTENTEWSNGTITNVTLTWKINKASQTKPTVTDYTGEYDGEPHTIEATGSGTLEYSSDNATWSTTAPSITEVGELTVYVRVKADANHKASVIEEGLVEIAKKKIAKPSISPTSYVYNGSEKTPTITGFDSTLMTMTGTESATNVGTYTITIGLKDIENTEWSNGTITNVTLTWKIKKASQTKPTVTSYAGEYDGVAHAITATGDGTLEYSEDKVTWSTTEISKTDIGESTIYVRIKADSSHSASAIEEGTITITKKKITKPTLSTNIFIYNGNEITPTIVGYDSAWMTKTDTESATNVGTYTITIGLKDTVNTEWIDETVGDEALLWQIVKADSNIPVVTDYNGTYDGAAHTISAIGDRTLEYSTNGTTWSKTKPTRTNVGTTKVYVRIKADASHTASEVVQGTITITKLSVTKPTMMEQTYTYTGEEITPGIKNHNINRMANTGTESATNVGAYTITVSLRNTNNMQWDDGTTSSIVLAWEIEKADITPPVVTDYNGVYDEKPHTIDVSNVEFGTIKYSTDGTTWSIVKPTRTKIGETTVYVKAVGDSNHNDSEVVTGTIRITSGITDYEIKKYEVDETKKYINKIMPNTTKESFISNILLGEGYSVVVDTITIKGKEYLYTGGKTKIMYGNTVYKEYTNIVIGDTNGDGAINSADLLRIRQHLLNIKPLTGVYSIAADINYDNSLNSADLLRMRQHLIGTKVIK